MTWTGWESRSRGGRTIGGAFLWSSSVWIEFAMKRTHAYTRARVRPSFSLFLPFFPPLSFSLPFFFFGEKPARLRDRVFHTRSSIDGRKCIHRANRVASRVQQYATGEEERSVHVQWQVKFPFRTRISTRDLCPIRLPKKLNRGNACSSTPQRVQHPLYSKIFRISFWKGRGRFGHDSSTSFDKSFSLSREKNWPREEQRWQEIGSKGHERMTHLREEDVDDASVGVN